MKSQGHYIPILGAQIISQNKLYPSKPQINLKSILVGNGYFSPLDIAFGYWETLCTTNPGISIPIFNSTQCDIIAANLPRCMHLAKICYDNPDPAICLAVDEVCRNGVLKHFDQEGYEGGRNIYDITKPCEIFGFCYLKIDRIERYLNQKHIWKELGVPYEIDNFNLSSPDVLWAFLSGSDPGISTEPQVIFLLESGIDVLIYQGMLDLACNTAVCSSI
jgi:cathepsin A (carboxypeptidase C)